MKTLVKMNQLKNWTIKTNEFLKLIYHPFSLMTECKSQQKCWFFLLKYALNKIITVRIWEFDNKQHIFIKKYLNFLVFCMLQNI